MILKEIEMDLPYVRANSPENLSADDIKMDYELNWKTKRREFQLMTRCMTSMIERLIPRIVTKDCWKILIECVEMEPRDKCLNLLGVYSVQVVFDVKNFYKMDTYEKKQYVVTKVREGICKLHQYELIDLAELIQVCDKISEMNYVNEWFWKKPLKSKQLSVQIKVLHEVENVRIYMVFNDYGKNECSEKLLVEDIPDERVYSKYLGKLEWISAGTARLSTKEGSCFIEKC